jgi:ABC-type Fe3+/spermidine/putrescine transport system ATPase subunit
MVSLRVESLRKTFPGVTALDNVDFEVNEAEYLVILGPSGAGKTTLLRTIAGLTRQNQGHIYFDDHPVDRLAPFQRGVAYLPQNYSLFGHMTVWENAAFGPTVQDWDPGRRDQIVREMLNLVHLSNRRAAYPRELSGGMQQRVALARALATQARILLLDEPLRALDARLRLELRQELRDLAKYLGITTLHVTHDQEEAISIADRIAVLRRGRVIQIGKPEELYKAPANPFVDNFIGEANFFEGILDRVDSHSSLVILNKGVRLRGGATRIPVNKRVLLAVKTDACEVQTGKVEGENVITGTVIRSLFTGKRTTLELQTSVGLLKAKVPSELATTQPEGSEVSLRFSSEDGIVYPIPSEGLPVALEVE